MRAARIVELGSPPEPAEMHGAGAFEVVAVALNPLDLAVSNGRYFGGHPPLPYVPGAEAVARVDGERFYLFGGGFGTQRDGFLVESVDFPRTSAIPVPDALDDERAAACGIAGLAGWVPVTHKADVQPSDRVLVLAATGVVGSVAVQASRLRGAERIVAAGRDPVALEQTRELGAHETVRLDGDDLVDRFRAAFPGEGPTVVVDPLWGAPARAAVQAAAPGARIVQVGQSAAPEATLASADVRGKQLVILGHTNFRMSPDELNRAYVALAEEVAAGNVRIHVEVFQLERIRDAWAAQQEGTKAVVLL